MAPALTLLLVQGVLGAADTLWYHERVYALPARMPATRIELRLHAARDFVYAVVFLTLPFLAWQGAWAALLAGLLVAEIGLTLADFVVEDDVRAPFGGVAKGERLMHTVMAIVYGAFLARLAPILADWWAAPTALDPHAALTASLRWPFVLMGIGVALSGVRDLGASLGIRPLQRPLLSAALE